MCKGPKGTEYSVTNEFQCCSRKDCGACVGCGDWWRILVEDRKTGWFHF